MMGLFRSILGLAAIAALALATALRRIAPPIEAAPEGQISFAVHVTLAPKWLDPGETESAITPFMMLSRRLERCRSDALVETEHWPGDEPGKA